MPREAHEPPPAVAPIAGVLAWVLPGLGHAYRGEPARGGLIGLGVLGLFFGGLLIAGLAAVDTTSKRFETRLSFVGQAAVGPIAIAVNQLHQSRFKAPDPSSPGEIRHAAPNETIQDGRIVAGGPPPMRVSVGKINEIGVLYALLAGMLNFIAILDALLPGPRGGGRGETPTGTEGQGSRPRGAGEGEPVRGSSVIAETLAGGRAGTGPARSGSGEEKARG